MSQYIFILGREPSLSVAEIAAVAKREGLELVWQHITGRFALIEADLPAGFMLQLAGTVKLAQVLGQVEPISEAVSELVNKILTGLNNTQCHFGFSWYGEGRPKWLDRVGMEIKKDWRAQGQRARYVVSREPQLSSVVVAKNKLLPPTGVEFNLVPMKGQLLVARTLVVQEFADWSSRDYGRPERDTKVGMLPPKLARLMVNLAAQPKEATLLDPFCGSGTVLQEAALLGYQELWGSDNDAQGIERTQKNFAWLKERYPSLTAQPTLKVCSIFDLPKRLSDRRFGAIVTEPYLGPPLTGREGNNRLGGIQKELTEFYQASLKTLGSLLAPGGRVVMVWPVLVAGKTSLPLPLMEAAHQAGFNLVDQLPSLAPSQWRNERNTLYYHRPGQYVGREIVALELD
jgi:tRNA (guanine10-N2)-dimethyltransferase